MKQTLNFALCGFLWWIVNKYGFKFHQTYQEMSKETSVSYGTIRNYLLELKKLGYLKIKNPNTWKQTYIINQGLYNDLFNEKEK